MENSKKIQKVKKLVDVMAIIYAIAFIGGFLELNFSDSFLALLGLIWGAILVWLLIITHKE